MIHRLKKVTALQELNMFYFGKGTILREFVSLKQKINH